MIVVSKACWDFTDAVASSPQREPELFFLDKRLD